MLNSLPVKWLHLLASGVVALIGVALGIGALALLFLALRETDAAYVTWHAVTYFVAAVGLASGSSTCMKSAASLFKLSSAA